VGCYLLDSNDGSKKEEAHGAGQMIINTLNATTTTVFSLILGSNKH
jgi:hypothetical protein